MRIVVLAAVAMLAACSHPRAGIEVRQVEVLAPQPCLAADEIPPEPGQVRSQLTGKAATDLVIVAASALELRAWGTRMHRALVACAVQNSPSHTPNGE